MNNEGQASEVRGEGSPPQPEAEAVGAAAGTASSEAEALRQQLEEERDRAERCKANWQRAEADLANFRRRAEQERADLARYANATLIGRILPVLDDFERALGTLPEQARSARWVEGIRLIDRKLRTILEQEGLSPIDALGKQFDPHVHEAVLREDGEGDTDVVVAELQKGYRYHDRVLRPAMVKVGRGSSGPSQQSEKE